MFDSNPAKPSLNRQARWLTGDRSGDWRSYGAVTHCEAARLHAEFFGRGGPVETREDGSDVTFDHRVDRREVFDVTPLRCDRKEVDPEVADFERIFEPFIAMAQQ